MPTQGMTVEPDGYISEETGEFIQTGHTITGTAAGEAARVNEVYEHQGRFVDNEDGTTSYENKATEQDYNNILSTYGGEEVISDATQWAQDHFSQDEIDYYNNVIEGGDLNQIQEAVEFVWQAYNNRNEEAEMPIEEDGSSEEMASEDPNEQWVYDNVLSENDYQQLIERGAQILDNETIRLFNDVIDGGNREQIANAIRLLQNRVYGN